MKQAAVGKEFHKSKPYENKANVRDVCTRYFKIKGSSFMHIIRLTIFNYISKMVLEYKDIRSKQCKS